MIRKISGNVFEYEDGKVSLSLGGITVEIRTSQLYKDKIKTGEKVELWTHLEISERGWNLFGFLSQEERDMFEKLLSIPGIGPKSALAVMSQISVADLRYAISRESADFLKQKGLGLKTAEKIISSLKGKISGVAGDGLSDDLNAGQHREVYEALLGLGYKEKDIRVILFKLDLNLTVNERIKQALKMLS